MEGKHRTKKVGPIRHRANMFFNHLVHRGTETATIITLHVTALVVIDQAHILAFIGIGH